RVAGIERKRLESRKWRELGRGPLPSIAQRLAESESVRRTGSHRNGIPVTEIHVLVREVRRSVSISCPVELSLGRQRLSFPRGVFAGLELSYVYGPIERQGNILK